MWSQTLTVRFNLKRAYEVKKTRSNPYFSTLDVGKSSFRYQAKGATPRQGGIKAKQTAQWGGATLKLSAKSNLNTPLNVGKGRGEKKKKQTYHQSVFFRSLHGALI